MSTLIFSLKTPSDSEPSASYFRNMFGTQAEKALSVFVALSALGNVMAVLFSQGRSKQPNFVFPYSGVSQSHSQPGTRPPGRSAVLEVLGIQQAIQRARCRTLLTVVGVSDRHPRASTRRRIQLCAKPCASVPSICTLLAYASSSVVSYPLAIINSLISGGLLFLYTPLAAHHGFEWAPPFRASWPVVFFFFLANVFLTVAPIVPPAPGMSVYKDLPYWLHVVVGAGVFLFGGVYWLFWARILPRVGHYRLERHLEIQADGVSRNSFKKVPVE